MNILIFLTLILKIICITNADRSFRIDYPNNQFLKDGKPFRYVAGDLEYVKVPAVLWRDRMAKYRAAGINAIQTYIEWNSHETERGVYNFAGNNDIINFFKTAQELGMVVVLRPGPYIDAERDMGGLPYWLLTENPKMKLRTSDVSYVKEVERWYSVLLPKIAPLMYHNGGPIIMVQVENEYGSYYACDFAYTTHVRDLLTHYLGNDTVLFTTDGNGDYFLKCGKIDGVFATVDFGSNSDPQSSFNAQRRHQEFGPYVNSEYYPGWIDHWEIPHSQVPTQIVCKTLDKMLSLNASVNIYPLHGGTSFGFTAGANTDDGRFDPCITSYDFDAPLTEAGDPTDKYYAIRKVIGKYLPLPEMPLPMPSPKMELPPIPMKFVETIYSEKLKMNPIHSKYPMTFEALKHGYGFVLYSTDITAHPSDPAVLLINSLGDRAQVFVDRQYQGTLSRTQKLYELPINAKIGQRLDIFVENQGRLAYGPDINDFKGILSNVTIGPVTLTNWEHNVYFNDWENAIKLIEKDFNDNKIPKVITSDIKDVPKFFTGEFTLPNDPKLPLDTFLRVDGWSKGVAFLNGFNLGRYWPIAGPQVTLYVPAHLFKKYPEKNLITLFELETSPCNELHDKCNIQFVKTHVINGTTPLH